MRYLKGIIEELEVINIQCAIDMGCGRTEDEITYKWFREIYDPNGDIYGALEIPQEYEYLMTSSERQRLLTKEELNWYV